MFNNSRTLVFVYSIFVLLVISTISTFSTVSSQTSRHPCCSLPYTTLGQQALLLTSATLTVHTQNPKALRTCVTYFLFTGEGVVRPLDLLEGMGDPQDHLLRSLVFIMQPITPPIVVTIKYRVVPFHKNLDF